MKDHSLSWREKVARGLEVVLATPSGAVERARRVRRTGSLHQRREQFRNESMESRECSLQPWPGEETTSMAPPISSTIERQTN